MTAKGAAVEHSSHTLGVPPGAGEWKAEAPSALD